MNAFVTNCRAFWAKHSGRRAFWPAACYLLAAAAWLVLAAVHCAADSMARSGGTLVEQTLSAADFQLVDLVVLGEDGETETGASAALLETTSGDPQMILENVTDGRIEGTAVRTLQLYCEFDADPREMCLYYTTAEGQPYSQDMRVFAAVQPDGSYLFTLPRGRLCALRLDPCSPEENKSVTLTLQKVVLNRPVSAAGYFVPSWYQLYCLVLYPALAAAALSWAAHAAAWLRGRKTGTR